eukprot:gene24015-biopygen10408
MNVARCPRFCVRGGVGGVPPAGCRRSVRRTIQRCRILGLNFGNSPGGAPPPLCHRRLVGARRRAGKVGHGWVRAGILRFHAIHATHTGWGVQGVRRCDPNMHRPTRADLSRALKANGQTQGRGMSRGPAWPRLGADLPCLQASLGRKDGPTQRPVEKALLTTHAIGALWKAGVVSEKIEDAINRPAISGGCRDHGRAPPKFQKNTHPLAGAAGPPFPGSPGAWFRRRWLVGVRGGLGMVNRARVR